ITARVSPPSKRTTTNSERSLVAAYVFTQARPRSRSTADMTASAPSSSRTRYRGTFSIVPAASRRKESSTASIASAGVSSRATSASERCSAKQESLGGLLRDHADLAARLEHGPLDVVEGRHLLVARLDEHLVEGQPLPPHVPLDRLTVLDDDDRLAVERRPQARKPVAEERDEHLQHHERPDDDHGAGHRVIVLGQTLLDRVPDHDQQDQVERLERRELALADDPRQQEDEAEQEGGSKDEIHRLGEDRHAAVDGGDQLLAVVEAHVLA